VPLNPDAFSKFNADIDDNVDVEETSHHLIEDVLPEFAKSLAKRWIELMKTTIYKEGKRNGTPLENF